MNLTHHRVFGDGVRWLRALVAVLLLVVLVAALAAPEAHAQGASRRRVVAAPQSPMAFPAPTPPQAITFATGPRGPVQVAGSPGMLGGFTVPMNSSGITYSRRSGLQLSIDPGQYGQYGYRTVLVTLKAKTAPAVDRQILFTFHAGDYSNRGTSMTVSEHFTMPAGSTSQTWELLVPQYQYWQLCGWKVLVDNQKDDELTIDWLNVPAATSSGSGSGTPEVVLATAMSQAEAATCSALLQANYNGNNIPVEQIDEADLPLSWIEYTPTDIVLIPAGKLAGVVKQYPAQATALLRWVRAGGNLWLLDAGRQWQQLSAANEALEAGKSSPDAGPTPDELPAGWHYAPLGERAIDPVEGTLVLSGFKNESAEPAKQPLAQMLDTIGGMPKTSKPWFAVRGYGLGAITAFRGTIENRAAVPGMAVAVRQLLSGQTPSPEAGMVGSEGDAGNLPAGSLPSANFALSQSLLASRVGWTTRHGNQPYGDNPEFNNFLIPNVGVAPVGQFQFLITLFVLAIGPLNYWLLKRRKKLPLLLATVPAAAAGVTLLLFLYGMMVDGVAVRARTRTLTLLDQRDGEAVCWGRLSYYAGIAPREGINIARDQAMYPIYPQWAVQTRFGNSRLPLRELVWDDQQRLADGWLQSRTPTQYQAIVARPSTKRLDLRATAEGLRVANRLGVDVTHLAVQDHDGKFYWCENLAAGQGQVVPAVEQETIAPKMRRLFTDNLPEFPSGIDPSSRGTYYGFQLSQNLMEARLEAINSPQIDGWGNGRYIAFTTQPIELELGVSATEEASFHVVEGTW
jgi:hypothetical protein